MTRTLPASIVAGLQTLGQARLTGIEQHCGASLAVPAVAVVTALRAAAPGLLGAVVEATTPDLDAGIASVMRRCRRCDQRQRMQACRIRQVRSVCGLLSWRRSSSRGASCHAGFCPADQGLDLDARQRLSAGLRAGWWTWAPPCSPARRRGGGSG